jgi:DNA-damage-inducible protein J
MTKTAMIRARVEPVLKDTAEGVLRALGLSPTDAITLFYKQVTLNQGLPFPVRLPNAKTRRAMQAARNGKSLRTWLDLAALKAARD